MGQFLQPFEGQLLQRNPLLPLISGITTWSASLPSAFLAPFIQALPVPPTSRDLKLIDGASGESRAVSREMRSSHGT
eukprot:CAMPEP_0182544798 /NCGR_PEP_ID=MMETSP1323-20130603/33662_1 /TAXON_ID=236787 /ORGANISM="Florenciella parvula, Strain RCC1693" /LENGTH=76 /DNA_ID=CAMNT_0024755881 /DNA_START=225 /DNA_END=455 /DNA_ORIENTATION=-